MESFKHLPGPSHIRVIELVKRTTRVYREEAAVESSMNLFLLDSEDVFIDLLTDSGTGAVTQSMRAATMYGDKAYNGSRSYYALTELVKNILGYQYTIPTHQGRGVEQIYIPVSTKKREQERGLDHNKMMALPNYFFDVTQGHSQINDYTMRDVYIKETFDTGVRYDFKGNFDLEGLGRGIEEVGPSNVSYVIATITSNPAGGQPISLVNLKAMHSIVKRYDIPVAMDPTRFAKSTYFIKQHEAEYKDWTVEQITRETHKYADMLAMSVKKDAMVSTGGLLHMRDDSFSDVYTGCGTLCMVQEGFPTYDGLGSGAMERLAVGLYDGMNLDWLVYRIAQVQYPVDGLEKIDVVCQQVGGHVTFVDTGKPLPHISVGQFPAQALACELYKVTGTHAVEIGSFPLGRNPKIGKQLSRLAELLRSTIPHTTYTQTHMGFIIEASKRMKENAANIKRLTFTYEPKVLRHLTAKLKEVQLEHLK